LVVRDLVDRYAAGNARSQSAADVPVSSCVQSGSSDEETLYRETGTVFSVHLLLHEDSWIRSCRVRHAELFQSVATISSPDGAHIGSQWVHRPSARARSVNLSADLSGRTARFGIASFHVQQPAELLSSWRLLAGDISGQLILIEHLPKGGKKSRQFSREPGLALRLVRERQ
jgi:hypothetical protein